MQDATTGVTPSRSEGTDSPVAIAGFIGAMPKAEIHIHLEGSIAPQTLLELARRHDAVDTLPGDNVDALQRWFTFTDFPHFVKTYFAISRLLQTPDDFATIVMAAAADMAEQNIRYRELTVTPFNHTHLLGKSLTIGDILEGLDAGRAAARAEYGVEMRWVFDIPRNAAFGPDGGYDPFPAEETLRAAIRGMDHGVVGFGLGGWEVGAPPAPFAETFARAKAAGLLSVPHAGETEGPDSVRGAILLLGADRIGHGVRAVEDPALVALLRDRQIPLEVNPTSNVCLHLWPELGMHPFPALDQAGVLLTINSDDPPLFNTNLCREYECIAGQFGYGREALAAFARNAFVVSGAPADLKRDLLAEFDDWAAANVG